MEPSEAGSSRLPPNMTSFRRFTQPTASVTGSQTSLSSTTADLPRPSRFFEDLETHHVIPEEYTRDPHRSPKVRDPQALADIPNSLLDLKPPRPLTGEVYPGGSASSLASQQSRSYSPSSMGSQWACSQYGLSRTLPFRKHGAQHQGARQQSDPMQLCRPPSPRASLQANAGSEPSQPHQPSQPSQQPRSRSRITSRVFARIKKTFRRGNR